MLFRLINAWRGAQVSIQPRSRVVKLLSLLRACSHVFLDLASSFGEIRGEAQVGEVLLLAGLIPF